MIPKVVEKDKAPLRREKGVDKDNSGSMDMSSGPGPHRAQSPHGGHQTSRERTDLNNEEGMMVDAQ